MSEQLPPSDRPPEAWERRYAQPPVTNGYAIASLVLGIVWLWWLGSILALVFGYSARAQIMASDGRQGGEGLAIAGIVLGWVGVGTFVYFALLVGSLTQVVP
jgi:hypothetical protein